MKNQTRNHALEKILEQQSAVFEVVRQFGMEAVLSQLVRIVDFVSEGESYLAELKLDLQHTLERYQIRNQDADE